MSNENWIDITTIGSLFQHQIKQSIEGTLHRHRECDKNGAGDGQWLGGYPPSGPAYPTEQERESQKRRYSEEARKENMTLREYYASQALMSGLVGTADTMEEYGEYCVRSADSVIAALDKEK